MIFSQRQKKSKAGKRMGNDLAIYKLRRTILFIQNIGYLKNATDIPDIGCEVS